MVSYKHAHLRTCEIHVWLAMESVRASETKYGENSLETPRHKACSNTSRADMQTLRNPSSHKFLTSFFFFFADHSSEKTVNLTSHHARRCLCRTVVNSFSHRDTVRRDSTRLEQPAQTLQMPELEQVLRVQMESRTNHFLIASDVCRNACPISTDAFTNTGLTLRGH